MSPVLEYDEEASRRVEAIYTTPDVVAQRAEVLRALNLCTGERVLDVGSGPGLLAFDMGLAVGPPGQVIGIDISESMLAMSRARCSGQPQVEFHAGDATRLPFPDGAFDVVASTQVYEYVGDVPTALAELSRVLRPGGRAVIVGTDWDTIVWHTTDRPRAERVLAAWGEHAADPFLPRTLRPKLKRTGFLVERPTVIPLLNAEYDANTYSHGLIGLIVAFAAGRRGVTREEAQAWAEDLRTLGEAGAYFFSLNRYLFLVVKPEARKIS